MSETKHAVVLLSGGLDSSTLLAIAMAEGFTCHCLSFSYGQRHNAELKFASDLAVRSGVEHRVANIDIGAFGGSALTGDAIDVPVDGDTGPDEIPVTYVPARNTVFLSYAPLGRSA